MQRGFILTFLTIIQDLGQLALPKKNLVAATMTIHEMILEFFQAKQEECYGGTRGKGGIEIIPVHPPVLLDFLPSSLNILVTFTFLDFVPFPTPALTVKPTMMKQASVQHVFLLSFLNISEISGQEGTRLGLRKGKIHLY